jgi:hypothetical protein
MATLSLICLGWTLGVIIMMVIGHFEQKQYKIALEKAFDAGWDASMEFAKELVSLDVPLPPYN